MAHGLFLAGVINANGVSMFQPVGTGFQLVVFMAHQSGREETRPALEGCASFPPADD
jgi:hypothetical protein